MDSTELLVLIQESLWKLFCTFISAFVSYNMEWKLKLYKEIWYMKHIHLSKNLKEKCSLTTKPTAVSLYSIKNYLIFSIPILQLQTVHQHVTISELLNKRAWNFILGEFYQTLSIHSSFAEDCVTMNASHENLYTKY